MILIIGGSGFLGYYLHHSFVKNKQKVISTYFNHKINEENFYYLDVTDKKNVHEFIQEIQPSVIIYASAITDVDLCETNKDLAKSVNVDGLENIIETVKYFKSKLVYISTSAVFDGLKNLYTETEKINPTSFYGITKSMGEKLILNSGLSYLIIRTDQPYGWKKHWHHTNSVLRVIENLNAGKTHSEISNWYNTPTYVPDFVNCVQRLLDLDCTGIFNVVGPDFQNRLDLALSVADIFDLDKKLIKSINSSELGLTVKRANVRLDNKKILEKTGIKMSDIHKGLKKMQEMKFI